MPITEHSRNAPSRHSRRAVLAAAGPIAEAAAVGTGAAVQAAVPAHAHPDAELLRLGCDFGATLERAKAAEGGADDAINDACGAMANVAEEILEHRAATLDGLRVKARMVAEYCSDCWSEI